jgi:hypothetical protein
MVVAFNLGNRQIVVTLRQRMIWLSGEAGCSDSVVGLERAYTARSAVMHFDLNSKAIFKSDKTYLNLHKNGLTDVKLRQVFYLQKAKPLHTFAFEQRRPLSRFDPTSPFTSTT